MIHFAKKIVFWASFLLALLLGLPLIALFIAGVAGADGLSQVAFYGMWLFYGLYTLGPALVVALLGLLVLTLVDRFKRSTDSPKI